MRVEPSNCSSHAPVSVIATFVDDLGNYFSEVKIIRENRTGEGGVRWTHTYDNPLEAEQHGLQILREMRGS